MILDQNRVSFIHWGVFTTENKIAVCNVYFLDPQLVYSVRGSARLVSSLPFVENKTHTHILCVYGLTGWRRSPAALSLFWSPSLNDRESKNLLSIIFNYTGLYENTTRPTPIWTWHSCIYSMHCTVQAYKRIHILISKGLHLASSTLNTWDRGVYTLIFYTIQYQNIWISKNLHLTCSQSALHLLDFASSD